MKFKLKNLLIGGVVTSMMPLVALSASCGKTEEKQETGIVLEGSKIKLDLTKAKNDVTLAFKSLNSENKYLFKLIDKESLVTFLSNSAKNELYFDSYKNKDNLPQGYTSYQNVTTSEKDFNIRKTVMKIYSNMKNFNESYLSAPLNESSLDNSSYQYYREPDKRVTFVLSEDKTTVTMNFYETTGVKGQTLNIDENARWTLEIKIK